MAAILCCGQGVALSHRSAAALWGIGTEPAGRVEVTSRSSSYLRRPGIGVHRRPSLKSADVTSCHGIPLTCPVRTLLDLAAQIDSGCLERAINEADRLDLVSPDALRQALGEYKGQPGVARLRTVLDRRTFRLTRSELERLFLPLVEQAGLPRPSTKQWVNGFEVDFYWPQLGFVVETDGLRYHRTPAQQARDRLRDQTHTAAGLTPLRFTHAQVKFEPVHVCKTLTAVARRLRGSS
ncbi:MAG TPA: DUF559 domain-containing protein [Solirubrobacterales bacterium]|nr:DUF559 domain-containing protein [Solirubrobacterales bacterium]